MAKDRAIKVEKSRSGVKNITMVLALAAFVIVSAPLFFGGAEAADDQFLGTSSSVDITNMETNDIISSIVWAAITAGEGGEVTVTGEKTGVTECLAIPILQVTIIWEAVYEAEVEAGDIAALTLAGKGSFVLTGEGSITIIGNVLVGSDLAVSVTNGGLLDVTGNLVFGNGVNVAVSDDGALVADNAFIGSDADVSAFDNGAMTIGTLTAEGDDLKINALEDGTIIIDNLYVTGDNALICNEYGVLAIGDATINGDNAKVYPMEGPITFESLTINGNGAYVYTWNGGLTVAGDLIVNGDGAIIAALGEPLNVNGNVTVTGDNNKVYAINGSVLTVDGIISVYGDGEIFAAGEGTLNAGGIAGGIGDVTVYAEGAILNVANDVNISAVNVIMYTDSTLNVGGDVILAGADVNISVLGGGSIAVGGDVILSGGVASISVEGVWVFEEVADEEIGDDEELAADEEIGDDEELEDDEETEDVAEPVGVLVPSAMTVGGSITMTGVITVGEGGSLKVAQNVTFSGPGAIEALSGGKVNVGVSVFALDNAGEWTIVAIGEGSVVDVGFNVTTNGGGVFIAEGGLVLVEGTLSADIYMFVGVVIDGAETILDRSDFFRSQDDQYYVYTDGGEPASYLYIRYIGLYFWYSEDFDIPEGKINTAIEQFSVADAAEYGSGGYWFKKVSGPEWLMVSSDGEITGIRPATAQAATTMIIMVTDSVGNTATITINVGEVIAPKVVTGSMGSGAMIAVALAAVALIGGVVYFMFLRKA